MNDDEAPQELLFQPTDKVKTAQAVARRYVYRMLTLMLEHELSPDERHGWMFGGVELEPDLRRLRKAIKAVMKELRRKVGD